MEEAAELVSAATSDKLNEFDLTQSIHICQLVAHNHRHAKDVIKAIKKRVGSKNTTTQLFSVMLLEMLMNNIGEPIHKQVIDTGLLPLLVKIVKKKSDLPVREKIFLLLDATQTSLGGASGSFPQYYSAYYDLVSAGVQFTQCPPAVPKNYTASDTNKHTSSHEGPVRERHAQETESQIGPESSVIEKARAALDVLREVLDAVDAKHPEAAKDEFALDLVEQCSFQKQKIMHLVLTSRDEKVVGGAIEVNEQLQKVLEKHDELICGRSTTSSGSNKLEYEDEEEQEEAAEQLIQRIRKGKGCTRAKDLAFQRAIIPEEIVHRPIIRPQKHEDTSSGQPSVAIPPPPAKHVEREKFFQENKTDDASASASALKDLSLHTRNSTTSPSHHY